MVSAWHVMYALFVLIFRDFCSDESTVSPVDCFISYWPLPLFTGLEFVVVVFTEAPLPHRRRLPCSLPRPYKTRRRQPPGYHR